MEVEKCLETMKVSVDAQRDPLALTLAIFIRAESQKQYFSMKRTSCQAV